MTATPIQVLAGVGDASGADSLAVCDWARWAARRLDAPLELLHVHEPQPDLAPLADLSGALGIDARDSLLRDLARLDEERQRLTRNHARELLERLRDRVLTDWPEGLARVTTGQASGELTERLDSRQPGVRLFVLGRRRQSTSTTSRLHLDHHLERAVRALRQPVLVAAAPFREPQRFLIAFDGSETGRRTVERIAASPLLRGLACHVAIVTGDTTKADQELTWARQALAGFDLTCARLEGEPETALVGYAQLQGMDLLAMGAYGHSRMRHLILGSTTTTLLRTSPAPVLVIR